MIRITLKFGGSLRRRAPADLGLSNGKGILELEAPMDIRSVLQKLQMPESEDEVLIVINDEIVSPSERPDLMLDDGDHLILMPPVKGG